MKTKGTILAGIAFLVLAAFVALVSVGVYTPVSAEEFAKNFAAKSADGHEMKGESGTYKFDTMHSAIGFRVKHMGLVDVPGYFRDFSGTVVYDAKNMKNSSVEFTAKMESVDTGVAPRDKHLRSKDFFEVETYPEMKFVSTKVEKKGKNWLVTGDLTMKDVTKEVMFPFNITGFAMQRGTMKMGIVAETVINRRDFNVNYGGNMPNGKPMLADNIPVILQIEAAFQKEEKAMEKKQGK